MSNTIDDIIPLEDLWQKLIVVEITPIDKKDCDDGCKYWNVYNNKIVCDLFDIILKRITKHCLMPYRAQRCKECKDTKVE